MAILFGEPFEPNSEGLINITALVKAGNAYRHKKGLPPKPLHNIMDSVAFLEMYNEAAVFGENILKVVGQGQTRSTWAHKSLAGYVATVLDTSLKFQAASTIL